MDLHTHTISSGHAFSTLKENIEEASLKGLDILGTSDHAMKMPGTVTDFFFSNYKVIRRELMGVKILRGIEANICDWEGTIDVDEKLADNLDYIIASMHSHCVDSGTVEQNTDACIGAMKNPRVSIIGHPDDSRFPLDYERLVRAAGESGVALELNNSSLLPTSSRSKGYDNAKLMLEKAKDEGVMIIVGSDSHIHCDVGRFDEALALIEEVGFPEELVVNTSQEKLEKLLKREYQLDKRMLKNA